MQKSGNICLDVSSRGVAERSRPKAAHSTCCALDFSLPLEMTRLIEYSRKIYRIILFSLILTAALFICGCGFHLRGHVNLPPKLKVLYLNCNSTNHELATQLKNMLETCGAKVVYEKNKKAADLTVVSDNITAVQASVAANQQMRVYSAVYSVVVELRAPDGTVLLSPSGVSASQNITMMAQEVLTNTSKLEFSKRSLTPEIVTKILYLITSDQVLEGAR